MTQETINQILKFRDDRDWKQFHNPKDLAISISLEASELLEVFQWSGAETSSNNKIEEIKEELADVVNYCVLMADACGLDLDEIVQTKIEKTTRNIQWKSPKERVTNMINCNDARYGLWWLWMKLKSLNLTNMDCKS